MALKLVAIVGRPNVGKSSLFNRLVGSRLAITDDAAHTTRNANTGLVSWNKHHFMLVDTAGLSKEGGEVEAQAQEQILEMAGAAEVIVVAVDAGVEPTLEDQTAARLALKTGKPVILALSKADTAGFSAAGHWRRLGVSTIVPVSAIHGTGTGDLLDAICDHLPNADTPEVPSDIIKLALIGRPNVGKSSLLNSLVGKQKALVSSVPGTTRDVSREEVRYKSRTIALLDTAGIRRRGKIEAGVEKFSALRTLAAITEADICVLVMDATEGPVAGDQSLAGQIIEAGKGLVLAVNKWDAVEPKDEHTQDQLSLQIKRDFQFAWWAPLVFTSATQGLHVNQLMELAVQISERRKQTIATGPLNRLLETITAKHPPAGLKSRQPKMRYGTQTGTNPPAFTFFATYADVLHFSYKRYIENNLRSEWDFTGTPIQLSFRDQPGHELRGRKGQ